MFICHTFIPNILLVLDLGMGIARIPIPITQIHSLVGYNTHTHTQNTQLFFGYSNEFFFVIYQK